MDKVIQSPGKYIQGPGVLTRVGGYAKPLGSKFLVVGDSFVLGLTQTDLTKSLAQHQVAYTVATFEGECCQQEITRLQKIAQEYGCNGVMGVGGGKTLDTAKAVAHYLQLPVIVVPTIASSDAPCSALSVIYTPTGEFESYLILPRNPDMVLMDSQIIANAPARLLAAGMGDALATYIEARASLSKGSATMAGGAPTLAALSLAKLCQETLLAEGHKAMLAAQQKVATEALERIIEANTYLSGIGFESGGLAAAHAVHNGLTAIEECHHYYHGEKVAFGILVQLVLENVSTEELERICGFCCQIGLPISLEQLDIKEQITEKAGIVAKAACAEGETIHNMPFVVTPEKVYAAILAADAYGRDYLVRHGKAA